MTRLNRWYVFASILLLAAVPTISSAAQSYDNCTGFIDTVPAVITTQGTWCVRHDLATAVSSGAAITVATNNVTIDCNDFKVGGLGAGAGTLADGILATSRLNTTVRHCNVRGFYVGIYLTGGGAVVEDNRLDGNATIGIAAVGDGSVVRRNLVTDTGGSTQTNDAGGILGIYSVDVVDNTVSGVTAIGSGVASGIALSSNLNGTVSGNHLRGLVSAGNGSGGGTAGIISNGNGGNERISFRDNDVVGDGSTGSQGITCTGAPSNDNGRTIGNVVSNFVIGIAGCSNDSGNIIVP